MQWVRPLQSATSQIGMRAQIRELKKRRDELLNLAVTRQEQPDVLEQVREVNRWIEELEQRLGLLERR